MAHIIHTRDARLSAVIEGELVESPSHTPSARDLSKLYSYIFLPFLSYIRPRLECRLRIVIRCVVAGVESWVIFRDSGANQGSGVTAT